MTFLVYMLSHLYMYVHSFVSHTWPSWPLYLVQKRARALKSSKSENKSQRALDGRKKREADRAKLRELKQSSAATATAGKENLASDMLIMF